jgi:DNA-binding response OmpR family regulator
MHTILIIEDEEPLRQTLVDRLTMEGFTVATATNGEEGLREARQHPPNLVLCDIMMPVLDGYGVLRALKADPRTATIQFVFLSAKADPLQVRAGLALGADDYLCKPVGRVELLAAIRTQIRKNDAQQLHP